MELYISRGLTPLHSYPCFYSPIQSYKLLTQRSIPFTLSNSLRFKSPLYSRVSNKSIDFELGNGYNLENEELIDVIGIGSRTDAVFDFCSHSPFLSPILRFWNFIHADSTTPQLHQFTGKDVPTVMESSSGWESCSKAVILVATAAYASDHIRVLDILNKVKSTNRLAVAIIIKPFSFEGRRRQLEVVDLLENLQEHTYFCIGIDTNVLLEKDFVTLDEALRTANTAVLMALNAVTVLVSKSKKKLVISLQDNMKELEVSEILEILECYKQAEVGFGAGYNFKTSTMRAIYDCPFLSTDLKDLDGIVIGILASSDVIDTNEIKVFVSILRQNTDFRGQIILSLVHEPNLEPNHTITTVITISHTRHQAAQKSSFFSQLSQRFPFIFNLLKRQPSESRNSEEGKFSKTPTVSGVIDVGDSLEMPDLISATSEIEGFGNYSAEIQTLLSNNNNGVYNLSVPESNENGFSEEAPDDSSFYDRNTKGVASYEREPLIRMFEPVYSGPEDMGNDSRDTSLLDKLSTIKLPVGVKPSPELKSSLYNFNSRDQQKEVDETIITPRVSTNTSADASLEAFAEVFDTGSPILRRTTDRISKRDGVVSSRAASMLEAERHSQKKWNPIMEMKYRGGLYKGRCQGGLPEGKGRLSLSDGSIYDGMWRSGKRSGLGTFYFSNGDLYQGSWRDDVMHGKGWLYFQTGDRWFVNFWKGKANGEGRFYSNIGEIFFGHFKDGWRHGHFLCISVDGERYLENWEEGVRVSRKQLDVDFGT